METIATMVVVITQTSTFGIIANVRNPYSCYTTNPTSFQTVTLGRVGSEDGIRVHAYW